MYFLLLPAPRNRLMRELQEMRENVSSFITADLNNDNMYHWKATIIGPQGSPYVGGVFKFEIQFPVDYPLRRPNVVFNTPIYHPNIESGLIRSDLLSGSKWNPSVTITKVLFHISDLLKHPQLDRRYAVQSDAANMYQENKAEYFKVAKKWTKKYANLK